MSRRLLLLVAGVSAVLSCGGTTGRENILASSHSIPDTRLHGGSSSLVNGDASGVDLVDASPAELAPDPPDAPFFDRSVPQRPPPQDAGGAPVARRDDAASGSLDAGNDGAEAGPRTTASILAAQSSDCLSLAPDGGMGGCAASNGCLDPAQQGGVCETVPGLVGRAGGVSEAQLCLQTLEDVLTSKCAAAQETHCLCGDVSPAACFAGVATPMGPAYPDYVEDFGANINGISQHFTDPAFGAGQANSIVQCLALWGCGGCFGVAAADAGPEGG